MLYKEWQRPVSKSVYQTPILQFERNNPDRLGFPVTYSRLECPATIRANQSVDKRTDVFQGHVNNIRGNLVLRFMVVKVLTCATVPRVRIHPSKAKNRPNNLGRSPLHLGSHRKEGNVVRNTFPTPVILAHKQSALFWVVDDPAASRPHRIRCLSFDRTCYSMLACALPPYQTSHDSFTCLLRPEAHHIEAQKGPTWRTPSSHNMVSGVLLMFIWCPCMAINVSVQYNGGLLPDITLLTQSYFHRGTRLNAMKRFCICSL